jgi:hypothetical protein
VIIGQLKRAPIASAWTTMRHDMSTQMGTKTESTVCHHCGQEIVWCRTEPDPENSYWAHAIRVFNGRSHTVGNALMEQRCADGKHWATPARNVVKWSVQIVDPPALANSRHFGRAGR